MALIKLEWERLKQAILLMNSFECNDFKLVYRSDVVKLVEKYVEHEADTPQPPMADGNA